MLRTLISMKRLIDVLFSVLGIALLAPLLLTIAFWVRLDSPGPCLFRQERVGLGGRLFDIFKFRSMRSEIAHTGDKITAAGDKRVTKAGRFLRAHKLDEMPQLFNVLRGDMSLVGPRPEVPEFVAYYPADKRDRILSVRPGITDPAALEFSEEEALLADAADPVEFYVNELLPKKLEYYERYLTSHSISLDLLLIFKTVYRVFVIPKRHDI